MASIKEEYEREQRILAKEELTLDMAQWMIDHKCTIRDLEKEFLVHRSTIHYRLNHHLKNLSYDRYLECRRILTAHKRDRIEILQKSRKPRK